MAKKSKGSGLKYNAGDLFRQSVGGIRRTYALVAVIGGNGLPGTPLFQLELVGRARLGDQVFLTLTEGQIDKNLTLAATAPGTGGTLPADPPVTEKEKEAVADKATEDDTLDPEVEEEISEIFKDLEDALGIAETP